MPPSLFSKRFLKIPYISHHLPNNSIINLTSENSLELLKDYVDPPQHSTKVNQMI